MKLTYIQSIIEETLTKRPYVKHLTSLMLSATLFTTIDGGRLARECLKNLTAEDFMQLAYMEGAGMVEYERAYSNI